MKHAKGHAHPHVAASSDDIDLVQRAIARDSGAFRVIMQRYNQRLYRIARSILRNDGEAEDVVQEAYVRAFTHLDGFRGESSLATWLSRITINEALGRLRSQRPTVEIVTFESQRTPAEIIQFPLTSKSDDPERTMAQRQLYSSSSRQPTISPTSIGLFSSRA